MIESIEIRNFKGIRTCKLNDLAQVNILIGRNGAGKSTVLEALYVASAWIKAHDSIRKRDKLDYVVKRRTSRGDWSSLMQVLWFSMNLDNEVKIVLALLGRRLKFQLVPHHDAKSAVFVDLHRYVTEEQSILYNYYMGYIMRRTPSGFIFESGGSLRERIVKTLGKELIQFLGDVTLIDDYIMRNTKEVEEAVWPELLANRQDKIIVDLIGMVMRKTQRV